MQEINAAGGIDGRQIELIVRDTQSEPTKAVNGAAELTHAAQGERRASVRSIPASRSRSCRCSRRANTPQIHPCWVDSLTDPKKYPMCFRNASTNQQIGAAANRYVVDVLKRKKVAVISDTTGYGTASVNAYVPMLKAKGAEVVYQGNVDAANPDLTAEILRMRNAGAEAIMPWSVNPGFLSRIINTRGQMKWDVPIVGQTTLGSGQTAGVAGKAGILGQGLSEQFPPGLLQRRRQADRSHHRLPRPPEERQDRSQRHAVVVDRGRLRLAEYDRAGDEECPAPNRNRSSAISTS